MKSRNDFIDFYRQTFHKVLKDYVLELRDVLYRNIMKIVIEQIFIIIITIICCYAYKSFISVDFKYFELIIFLVGLLAFITFLILNIRLFIKKEKELCEELNTFIYEAMLEFLSNDEYVYEKNTQLAKEDFDRMNLFNLNILHYSGSNLTASICEDKKFVMTDVFLYDVVERIKTDSYYSKLEDIKYIINYHYKDKVNIFKGLYYETSINRYNDEYIYLIPDNINDKFVRNNIYHYIKYYGHRVELENLEFEKKYEVYSVNELKSRYILSLTLMEKINRLDKLIDNKKYLVFKKDGRVGIFINNFQIDKLLKQKISLYHDINIKYLISFFIKVQKLYKIALIMEDITPFSD